MSKEAEQKSRFKKIYMNVLLIVADTILTLYLAIGVILLVILLCNVLFRMGWGYAPNDIFIVSGFIAVGYLGRRAVRYSKRRRKELLQDSSR